MDRKRAEATAELLRDVKNVFGVETIEQGPDAFVLQIQAARYSGQFNEWAAQRLEDMLRGAFPDCVVERVPGEALIVMRKGSS